MGKNEETKGSKFRKFSEQNHGTIHENVKFLLYTTVISTMHFGKIHGANKNGEMHSTLSYPARIYSLKENETLPCCIVKFDRTVQCHTFHKRP